MRGTIQRHGRLSSVANLHPPPNPAALRTAPPQPMSALEAFVRDHQAGVWRYLRLLGAPAADADDLLQETFLRFLARTEPHPAAPAMLRTIARGLWVDRHRWLQRHRARAWALDVDHALAAVATDDHQERWLDALRECRAKLTERARRALDLAYRDGCGRDAMAHELGLAPNTVRNLLASTRELLRQCIERRIHDSDGAAR